MTTGLDIYSLVGFVGTACIIGAYFYLTASDKPDPWVLHGTNLTGAALLTISLLVHTNWPSLVLEGFWAAIAIWGLSKAWRSQSPSRPGGGVRGGKGRKCRKQPTPGPSREREGRLMILRRVFAAIILFAFAIGSSLYWADWQVDLRSLAINCTIALLGLVLLHFRWRTAERRIVTPRQGKDTFS